MLTPEILLAAGYREHPVPTVKSAARFYQRRITDEDGTRYFVDVYQYAPIPAIGVKAGYEFELYSTTKAGVESITLLPWVTDLEQAEAHLAQLWERMECRYHGEPKIVTYDRSLEGVE